MNTWSMIGWSLKFARTFANESFGSFITPEIFAVVIWTEIDWPGNLIMYRKDTSIVKGVKWTSEEHMIWYEIHSLNEVFLPFIHRCIAEFRSVIERRFVEESSTFLTVVLPLQMFHKKKESDPLDIVRDCDRSINAKEFVESRWKWQRFMEHYESLKIHFSMLSLRFLQFNKFVTE